jgi:hypothetical protein
MRITASFPATNQPHDSASIGVSIALTMRRSRSFRAKATYLQASPCENREVLLNLLEY